MPFKLHAQELNAAREAQKNKDAATAALEKSKAAKKRLAEAAELRKALQKAVYNSFTPNAHDQGVMGKASHLAGLTAEGVAAEIFMDLVLFLFQFIVNSPYFEQWSHFNVAVRHEWNRQQQLKQKENGLINDLRDLETSALKPNETRAERDQKIETCKNELIKSKEQKLFRVVYQQYTENGITKLPDIYPLNEKTGKPNYDAKPIPKEHVTRELIRANGYIPRPSLGEGYRAVFAAHVERMSGASALSPQQRELLYHTAKEAADEAKKDEPDLRADQIAMDAMKMKQAAKK